MASRKEEKERLRKERIAKEEAERRESSRRRRMQIGAAAAALLVIAAVVVVIAVAGGGGSSTDTTSSGGLTFHKDSVPASAQVGLLDTPPPWKPDYKQLQKRVQAMGLPGFNETTFHIHAWLHVYVDGKQVQVPGNIGIDVPAQFLSPLHTHDLSQYPAGIIHMEADQEYDFTLGQFMNVWGVKFSKDQLGSLKAQGADKQLQVYLNGQLVNDPVNVVMHEHDNIVIGYGKPGSFPKEPKLNWPPGL
jgi:hypothetical protein